MVNTDNFLKLTLVVHVEMKTTNAYSESKPPVTNGRKHSFSPHV
jgi:hypothetical protein